MRTQKSEQLIISNLHMCKPSWLDILLFCFSFNVTVLHAFLYVALNPLGKIIMNAVTLLRQSRN